jgi:hypothetical protein
MERLTSHSGRRGGATETARAEAKTEELCDHFWWKRGSVMAAHYVAEVDARENNPIAPVM